MTARPMYFMPGEIVLSLSHQSNPNDLIVEVRSILNALKPERPLRLHDAVDSLTNALNDIAQDTIVTWNLGSSGFFISFLFIKQVHLSNGEIIALTSYLNASFNPNPSSANQIIMRSASPNWLSGVAQGIVVPTGGPGGKPTPATPPTDFLTDLLWVFDPLLPAAHKGGSTIKDVEVVILDTVPPWELIAQSPNDSVVQLKSMINERFHITYAERPVKVEFIDSSQLMTMNLSSSDGYSPSASYDIPNRHIGKILEEKLISGDPNENIICKDSDYDLFDHGLFVASIIHSIAPDAGIWIVEVLNERGVGNLESIINGLRVVKERFAENNNLEVVMNLSWTLAVIDGDDIFDEFISGIVLDLFSIFQADVNDTTITNYVAEILSRFLGSKLSLAEVLFDIERGSRQDIPGEQWEKFNKIIKNINKIINGLSSIASGLRDIQNTLSIQNTVFVGASGNRGVPGHRPMPKVPATLEDVIGVAALDYSAASNSEAGSEPSTNPTHIRGKKPGTAVYSLDTAVYSNVADKPPADGVITFGGTVNDKGFAIANQSILGPYTAKTLPNSDPTNPVQLIENKTQWVWWAGTSFATAVVSGRLAALVGNSPAINDPNTAITAICPTKAPQGKENILPAIQET